MNVKYDYTGARVLVTGAGTGIGRGIALAFGRAEAKVALHYSHSSKGAVAAAEGIRAGGGTAEAFQADFDDVEAVQRLGREAVDWLGGIDVLVNNAGITYYCPIAETTPAQFDRLYHVNVRAPYFLVQSVLPAMRNQGKGAIINISSIHAVAGFQEHTVYAGTRGAIVAFTRSLAIELAHEGIRVAGVAPGGVVVENYAALYQHYSREAQARSIPAGFVGEPDDIARAVLFLASDDARYVLGQTLIVDGGTTSWMAFGEGHKERLNPAGDIGYVPQK
ncbi:MAG: SDR family NAD(P)-dependent oxidoreductase [Armatimonadota bacterium]